MKSIAFFNNKGGVGKTSLVYHLAWMFAEMGINTLAVDLDPQANLTSMFLDEDSLAGLWTDGKHQTVFGALSQLYKGKGDILEPTLTEIKTGKLWLIPGDLELSRFEDKLSDSWPKCHNRDESAFRAMTAFYRIIQSGALAVQAEIILVDVGPNLGAINRSALISADYVAVPLAPDLFSIQGLKNLGPTLRDWRTTWAELLPKAPKEEDLALPSGKMSPLGYIVMQHSTLDSKPVKSYQKWMNKIPQVYHETILEESPSTPISGDFEDPHLLALIKHFRSLMPMAMSARKPMFSLTSADGAIGAHIYAVKNCFEEFKQLALKIRQSI